MAVSHQQTRPAPLLRVERASFRYGDRPIFDELTFSVSAGEILCLLGPNGSGKTTLFRCLTGSLKLHAGSIRLGEANLADLGPPAVARILGIVFQEHVASFPFTVLDVVRMGRAPHLGFFATPSAADTRRAEMILERLGIAALANRPYTAISGGECQLALIGRALCQEPRIMLLDEPTSHLDYRNAMIVLRTVRELARSGLAVIMTTHAPDQPLLLSSRVALLRGGKFIAHGQASDVLTSENLRRTYEMDIEVVRTPVPGLSRPVSVVVPLLDGLVEDAEGRAV
jgi:iron complex transport system ATP-binding protein